MAVQYIDNTFEEMKLQSALKLKKIVIAEEFTRESIYKVQYLINKIVDIDNKNKTPKEDRVIHFDISSYGGCAYSCVSLIGMCEYIREKYGYTIHTHINSMAMSAGFFFSICGDYRTMNRYGCGLIHPMLSGTGGSLQSMIDDVEHDKRLWSQIVEITKKYTGFTEDELEELKKCKTDKYMLAEEMLAKNCIDEIL